MSQSNSPYINWSVIFTASKVNGGKYDGDELPHNEWSWPKDTWLKSKLSNLNAAKDTEIAGLKAELKQLSEYSDIWIDHGQDAEKRCSEKDEAIAALTGSEKGGG